MKPELDGVSGAQLIAAERERQIAVKRYSKQHDDEHTDHSLALAACAYAAPQPLYYLSATEDVFHFVDCWPASWDYKYDHRERDSGSHRLLLAGETPVARRIRALEKAGALIAAEIDRLLRLQAKNAEA
jgi:hypothetical protein